MKKNAKTAQVDPNVGWAKLLSDFSSLQADASHRQMFSTEAVNAAHLPHERRLLRMSIVLERIRIEQYYDGFNKAQHYFSDLPAHFWETHV